jgi:putative restriction endonuclease
MDKMITMHDDSLNKVAFFKRAIARSYTEYINVVDDILDFFVVENNSPVSIAGRKETPSLTVRSQDGQTALFLFGTKGGCFIQILYNTLVKHSRITEKDNSALLEMAEQLSQIKGFPKKLSQIRGKPVLDLELLMDNVSRRLFIEAVFSLYSYLADDKSTGKSRNLTREDNLYIGPGVIEVWNKLVDLAEEGEEIQYSVLSFDLGVATDPSDAFAGRKFIKILHETQNYCTQNSLPSLTVLVHDRNGERGKGYIGTDGKSIDEEIAEVFNFGWKDISNPFDKESSFNALVEEMISSDGDVDNIYLKLPRPYRKQQPYFRAALLKIYNSQCAICNISHPSLLDAAHIKPWSDCESQKERADLSNGLILCKNHHYAFDSGIIWIDITGKVHGNEDGHEMRLYPSRSGLGITI